MKFNKKLLKKAALSAAIAGALGLSTAPAQAEVINMNWNGLFTMVTPSNAIMQNTDNAVSPWYGYRSVISGTMSFDTATGSGTGTVNGFSFSGGGMAVATSITMQAIGNGQTGSAAGPGPLVLGNMGFNWSGNNGIPVSIVLDASGLFGAIQNGVTVGQVIDGTAPGSATPASNGLSVPFVGSLPIGPAPIATTTYNTTNIGTVALGTNPSGTLPLTDDGIGGSPMQAGPFPNYNANFDVTSLTVTSVTNPSAVPIPAAVWLFGSGLVGLVGVARRKQRSS